MCSPALLVVVHFMWRLRKERYKRREKRQIERERESRETTWNLMVDMWAHRETREISSVAAAAGVFSGPPAGALIMAATASSERTLPFFSITISFPNAPSSLWTRIP
jgi:hypothetical protein